MLTGVSSCFGTSGFAREFDLWSAMLKPSAVWREVFAGPDSYMLLSCEGSVIVGSRWRGWMQIGMVEGLQAGWLSVAMIPSSLPN